MASAWRIEDASPKSEKLGKTVVSQGRWAPRKARTTHRTHQSGQETTRVMGAVKGRAGIKIKPKSHHFGGNTLTRARSRNSKQEHERCLPYMLAGHALVKTVALAAGEPPSKTAKAFDSIT